MVTKRLVLELDEGDEREIQIRYSIVCWEKMIPIQHMGIKATKWLVEYDSKTQSVNVDYKAPSWYITLATLHEMIYTGHFFEDLIPDLTNDNHRCQKIEEFILSVAGDHRQDYIKARRTMYHDLLVHNGYRKDRKQDLMNAHYILERQAI